MKKLCSCLTPWLDGPKGRSQEHVHFFFMTYFPVLSLPLLEWNNGLYSTADNRRPTTVPNTSSMRLFLVLFIDRSRRQWTCLQQHSNTVVCVQLVATRYSTPDTLKWTLYLWLNITLHRLLQKSTIVQSVWIWNVRINTDVVFSHNGASRPESKTTRMFRLVRQVAALEAKTAVSYCIVSNSTIE